MSVHTFDHRVSQTHPCACGFGLPICLALALSSFCPRAAFADFSTSTSEPAEIHNLNHNFSRIDDASSFKNPSRATYITLEKTSSIDSDSDLHSVARLFDPIYSYFVGSQKSSKKLNIIGIRDGDVWEFEKLPKSYSLSRVGRHLPPTDKRLQGYRDAVASATLVVAYEISSPISSASEIIAIVESDARLYKVTQPSAETYSIRHVGILDQSR